MHIDDSGVFDISNNRYFVYAGVVHLGKENKENAIRKYHSVERITKENAGIKKNQEAKGAKLKPKHKADIYRSLNSTRKFAVVVDCEKVEENIWKNKKSKQRFLDYCLKRAIKDKINKMLKEGAIDGSKPVQLVVRIDEHTTATDGCYELKEGIEEELINGTYNNKWNIFYGPILARGSGVDVKFINSEKSPLIRSADICANLLWYDVNFNNPRDVIWDCRKNIHKITLP